MERHPVTPLASADDEADERVSDAVESREIVAPIASHGQRLDKVLVSMAPEFSRNHLQSLIARGLVRIDGEAAATASRRVKSGQRITVELMPTEESLAFRPQPMDLVVLFEDQHVLVLDKPAGLVVHPAPGNWSGTLLNGLLARHAGAAGLPRAGIVHRLDKDTSGVMVVGKTLAAVTGLSRAIAARDVHRRYLALAHGVVEPATQSIDAPIGRDPVSRIKMAVIGSGKPARTDVTRLGVSEGTGEYISALQCVLHTGRTHQIRVHLAHRGHPLIADATYGGRPALGLTRQALHAARLEFAHPVDARSVTVDCAPPQDFAQAWRQVALA